MFNGDMQTEVYQDGPDCEAALIQKTDLGNYKRIKVAKCISLEEETK
jgi:hypothetical protein